MAKDCTPGNSADIAIVFYDGGCSLCRSEIAHYRRIDRECRLVWIDISQQPQLVRDYGKTVEAMMQQLHVLDATGGWKTGAAGFIELWAHLPFYRRLANLIILLRLERPLELVYAKWASWRMRCLSKDDCCGLSTERARIPGQCD